LLKPKVKIRGVYTTALTKLFLDAGFSIVQPSAAICQRFHLLPDSELEQVSIYDGEDVHSIIVEGDGKGVEEIMEVLGRNLLDIAVRPASSPFQPGQKWPGTKLSWQEFVAKFSTKVTFTLEFPYAAKATLDALRGEVTPTLSQHHLLKLIDAQKVDEAEASSTSLLEMAKKLKQELIYEHYRLGRTIIVEHVLLEGKVVVMKGKLAEFDPESGLAIIKRSFSGMGKYDGLNLLQEPGDWGIIEVKDGSWVCKRSYYRRSGDLIGEIYNINTGIELYPDKVRYLDLKVDVVRWAEGRVKMIDRPELYQSVKDKLIRQQLADKALGIAEDLRHSLEKG